ncbi:MAG: hypothetical protein NC177_18210 [Ruminococcus flavefaciens]|nr:hypothetical protein [Ruminococcus flavefaciens]
MSLYRFYHRGTGIIKSNACAGIQLSCNCESIEPVAFDGKSGISKEQLNARLTGISDSVNTP